MVTIVAIPSYYRTDSHVFIYKDAQIERPTTTAQCIVLTPASTETLTARNTAIAKDVTAWGWHVYSTDRSAPSMDKWFSKYEAAAKNHTWDDDIWRIWQREHGLKISARDAERQEKEAGKKGKKEKLMHEAKKAGVLFGKFGMTLSPDERRLRKEELVKEEERMWKLANKQVVASSEDFLGDLFADPPTARRRDVDEGDFKTGNLRGGGAAAAAADTNETLVEKTTASDSAPETRYLWLLGG